jgi:lysophospholipase L1-like esterase
MVFRPARLWTIGVGVLVATLGMASPAVAGTQGFDVPAGNVGDSYAAGEGGTELGSYLDVSDPTTAGCHRSSTSAFELLARIHVLQSTANVACGGATTVNITTTGQYGEPPQASQLTADLRLVYVMIGGNDIGFGAVAACFIALDCDRTPVPAATLRRVQQLGSRLDAAYAAIRARAPNARVVVTLYPSLLPRDPSADLSGCPEINPAEVRLGNQIQDGLNQTISDRARAHDFAVADPRPGFAGHDVCAGRQTYFYRPGTPGTYHPNLTGRVVMAAFDALATPTAVPTDRTPSA